MSTKQVAVVNFQPTQDVPDDAPPMPFDLSNPNIAFDDVLPDNYFSLDGLQQWLSDRNAESRVLTVVGVSMELLYDPAKEKPKDGSWKPCLRFAETPTLLVINKSRGEQLSRLVGSPLLAKWAEAGQVCIKPGIANGKAQICIEPLPHDYDSSVEDVNDDLFA